MRVITLNQIDFDEACGRLAAQIENEGMPDVVIGIESGGAVVAKKVFAHLSGHSPGLKHFDVSASRNTTMAKQKTGVGNLFRVLPRPVLDMLRLLEHYILRVAMYFKTPQPRNIRMNEALYGHLSRLKEGHVCVVDDAIDSGATMSDVLDELSRINRQLEFNAAVIVVTQSAPCFRPDHQLYEGVLIRFPWSSDFKQ